MVDVQSVSETATGQGKQHKGCAWFREVQQGGILNCEAISTNLRPTLQSRNSQSGRWKRGRTEPLVCLFHNMIDRTREDRCTAARCRLRSAPVVTLFIWILMKAILGSSVWTAPDLMSVAPAIGGNFDGRIVEGTRALVLRSSYCWNIPRHEMLPGRKSLTGPPAGDNEGCCMTSTCNLQTTSCSNRAEESLWSEPAIGSTPPTGMSELLLQLTSRRILDYRCIRVGSGLTLFARIGKAVEPDSWVTRAKDELVFLLHLHHN
jgi:hypothetical protein